MTAFVPNAKLHLGPNLNLRYDPETSRPYRAASSPSHIVVIGGGVTGLVTAWDLLDRGQEVTVVSKEWASYTKDQRLTSQIAGALWEYPPAACGQHTDVIAEKFETVVHGRLRHLVGDGVGP